MKQHTTDNSSEERRFFLPAEGKLYEVSENVYRAYYNAQNREEYLESRDSGKVLSYNALDTETSTGEGLMPDMMDSSPEEKALANELSDLLHRCLDLLPTSERELIHAIYYENLSDDEYASKVNLTKSGVAKKRRKILSRLRKLMNILGSFLFFVPVCHFFYLNR